MPTNVDGTSGIMGALWLTTLICILTVSRSDFSLLWGLYSISFALYGLLVFRKKTVDLKFGLLLALVIRILSFGFSPHLTDDYFRFIWDGMIMHQGINPMAHLPSYLMDHPELAMPDPHLFSLLNSPDYYSVYPPVAQILFYIPYAINHLNIGGHIFFYKGIALAADTAVIFLLYLLLKKNNLPIHRLLIYALNPLIIIEFAGNLHFEGVMIACLLSAVLFSEKRLIFLSSLFMTASIGTKLIPFMLIPFMPRQMFWKKWILWGITTLSVTCLIFWFIYQNTGWLQSINLWFRSFEFNAGFYYVIRELDSMWRGYDNIHFVGPLMAGLTLMLILFIWIIYLKKQKWHWSAAMLFALTIYFLMTTTLHPWYLSTILALSVISGHYYPVIWTYLVFLSYSHYDQGGFSEKYIFICVEYFILFGWMIFEYRFRLSPVPLAPPQSSFSARGKGI